MKEIWCIKLPYCIYIFLTLWRNILWSKIIAFYLLSNITCLEIKIIILCYSLMIKSAFIFALLWIFTLVSMWRINFAMFIDFWNRLIWFSSLNFRSIAFHFSRRIWNSISLMIFLLLFYFTKLIQLTYNICFVNIFIKIILLF